ncbi:metal ABC transporter ATP-binding protein [Weissella cibaria]|uniref:metal ABC transporter ATP-binding protein n=1 Tax=Weissella cibaria TaxID=137591 RepID=UPI0035BBC8A4
MTILTGSGVGIQFGERWLYQDVAFKLKKGRVLALIGDNGVGKTTLLRAILGQLELTAGELDWQIDAKTRMISYVPQYRPDMQAFPLKVTDFVSLSFDKGILPWLKTTEKERLQHVLADTHLTKIANARIDTASGGERQRAYLAQALVQNPNVLILDEATANLDNVAKYELMNVVRDYRDHHDLTTIMVSHDLDIIGKYADDYLLLTPNGSEFGPIDQLDMTKLKVGNQDHA